MTTEERLEGEVNGIANAGDVGDAAVVEPVPPAPDSADTADILDATLRSALEFAVGIAAAGQKLRPPLAYPPGLRTLLKFSRLDRAALRLARRAVVGDDVYRERLAAAATPEHVDAIGLLWLKRPDGWQQQARDLQAQARDEATHASAEAALRKAERRREAAEQAALRAKAELIGHHDAVAREQMRRERAEEMATTARREAAGALNEIAQLQRQVTRLQTRLAEESTRLAASQELASELAARLQEVEELRDRALADRVVRIAPASSGPREVPSTAGAAEALNAASRATRELAEALAEASRALTSSAPAAHTASSVRRPPRTTGPSRRAPRRTPIAIPGGVYGDSVAAADHLLRTPEARVIVDGYNVAKLAWPALELVDQRECCIGVLEDLVRRTGADVHVVFDGADVRGASAGRRLVRVEYSPAGISADDVIRSEVAGLPMTTPVVVVTNDQAIVNDVRAAGANSIGSDVFLEAIGTTSPNNPRR